MNTPAILMTIFGSMTIAAGLWEYRKHKQTPTLYIDVPHTWHYDWSLATGAEDVLCLSLPAKRIKFICNSLGEISEGDLCEIELLDEDIMVFYLRTGLKPFTATPEITEYRERRKR